MSYPFPASETGGIFQRYQWPVSWVTLPDAGEPPYVLGFRLRVEQPQDAVVRCYVTADERYELYVDGELISRGPERGSPEAWYYETLDVSIKAGRHVLFARVWALGQKAPVAQHSVRPGFLFGVEQGSNGGADVKWSTGLALWEVKRVDGYEWVDHPEAGFDNFTGKRIRMDGRCYPWGIERGEGENWSKAVINSPAFTPHATDLFPVRLLVPGTLPQMLRRPVPAGRVRFVEEVLSVEEVRARRINPQDHLPKMADQVQALLEGRSALRIPPRKCYRAIMDLRDYFCAYPQIRVSQGKEARMMLGWAEALFEELAPTWKKGDRNQVEGRFFAGFADAFIFDGHADRSYTTLWWEAGRYLELLIETRDEELVLQQLAFTETRYPLERESAFSVDDQCLEQVVPILLRSLQVNAHETFMDCPYYEQLNYIGDTLIDCLVFYTIARDLRLVRKSLQLFHDSRIPQGLTQSRFPSRIRQIIPPFSLLWVSMVHHHARWRGEREFVRSLLPGTRSVIDTHLLHIDSDGLLRSLRGWNFLDWVPAWNMGMPPEGDVGGASGPLNWLFVSILQAASELEAYAGEPELAARYARLAHVHALATESAFWSEKRGLFADDLPHRSFSEHAQCLAILSGKAQSAFVARAGRGLLDEADLHRCTIYFSHYLLETFRKLNRPEPIFARLEAWHNLAARGFVTTPEVPDPSRSDCHAWGCHPLYHFYATILGIRPAAMGFGEVEIRPQLGPMQQAAGRMVHPHGWIEADIRRARGRLEGTVTLPDGITGVFYGISGTQVLSPGAQSVAA